MYKRNGTGRRFRAERLPDGAGAYPAYGRQSPCVISAGWRCAYPAYERRNSVRNFCRMALRLSGLQNNAYPFDNTDLPW